MIQALEKEARKKKIEEINKRLAKLNAKQEEIQVFLWAIHLWRYNNYSQ